MAEVKDLDEKFVIVQGKQWNDKTPRTKLNQGTWDAIQFTLEHFKDEQNYRDTALETTRHFMTSLGLLRNVDGSGGYLKEGWAHDHTFVTFDKVKATEIKTYEELEKHFDIKVTTIFNNWKAKNPEKLNELKKKRKNKGCTDEDGKKRARTDQGMVLSTDTGSMQGDNNPYVGASQSDDTPVPSVLSTPQELGKKVGPDLCDEHGNYYEFVYSNSALDDRFTFPAIMKLQDSAISSFQNFESVEDFVHCVRSGVVSQALRRLKNVKDMGEADIQTWARHVRNPPEDSKMTLDVSEIVSPSYVAASRLYSDRKVCIDFLHALYKFAEKISTDEATMIHFVNEFNSLDYVQEILFYTLHIERATAFYINVDDKLEPEKFGQHWYATKHVTDHKTYELWDRKKHLNKNNQKNDKKGCTISHRLIWYMDVFFKDDSDVHERLGPYFEPQKNPAYMDVEGDSTTPDDILAWIEHEDSAPLPGASFFSKAV